MMKMLDLFRRNDGAAALEAALVAPLFLALTVGIADLGMGMFQAMDVNAAAQAGAMYVVINRTTSGDQPLMGPPDRKSHPLPPEPSTGYRGAALAAISALLLGAYLAGRMAVTSIGVVSPITTSPTLACRRSSCLAGVFAV